VDNPYPWLQDFIDQVPDLLQPLIVAAAATVPYFEGEGAVALGIIAGINPIVAAIAAIAGNVLCVIGVVLLGSRIRSGITARRAARAVPPAAVIAGNRSDLIASSNSTKTAESGNGSAVAFKGEQDASRPSKGQTKLRRWLVKFGLPGASLLAPLALPTMLTAAFFVASGVRKEWVILWQVVAIVLWTSATAVVATGVLALLGW
jgi:hypothetical protein